MRVLIVEDHQANRFFLSMGFQEAGHETAEARTAAEGLEAIGSEHFDVVIADFQLPDSIAGQFITQLINRRSAANRLKIIVVSGSADQDTEARILKAGADQWVSKPFDLDKLIQMAESLASQP